MNAARTIPAAIATAFHQRHGDVEPRSIPASNRCRAPTDGGGTGSSPSCDHSVSQSDRYALHSAHDAMCRSIAGSISAPPPPSTESAIASRALAHAALSSFQFTVNLPKLVERAMCPHARRGRRALEHARDIVITQIVVAAEHEHRTALRRESLHGFLEERMTFVDRVIAVACDHALHLAQIGRYFVASRLAPMVPTHVVRETIEPGRECRLTTVGRCVSEHAKQGFL